MDTNIRLLSRPIITMLQNAEVILEPEEKQGGSSVGRYVSIRVRVSKDIGSKESQCVTIVAYDDLAVRILDKMKIRKGDFISGTCVLAPFIKTINAYDKNGKPLELVSKEFTLKAQDIYLSCYQQSKSEGKKEETPKEVKSLDAMPVFDFATTFGG